MCPGYERWHPNPGFYYLPAADRCSIWAPTSITDLVNLLGPVASVSGVATRTRDERLVTKEPLQGTRVPVEVATHVTGSLLFCERRQCSLDDPELRRRTAPAPPDRGLRREGLAYRTGPQLFRRQGRGRHRFRGLARKSRSSTPMPTATIASSASRTWPRAIRHGRPHRASGALAFHVLEVMEGFQRIFGLGLGGRHRVAPGAPCADAGRAQGR